MISRFPELVSRFHKDLRGGVAMMMGLAVPIVFVGIGGAVDYTQSVSNTQKAQRVMDSVVLSLTRLDPDATDLQATGKQMFNAAIAASGIQSMSYNVSFNVVGDQISGAAVVENKTTFLGFIGIDSLDGAVEAAALPPSRRPLEIALALDVSGSMGKDLNGSPRIKQMITAVNEMFDTLDESLPSGTELSASVVPYSSSVNLSNYRNALENSSLALGNELPTDRDVWAAERFSASNGNNYTLIDHGPGTGPIPFITASEMSYASPFAPLKALDNNIDAVRSEVNSLTPNGWTAGHIGMIWGLYTLSPEWDQIWPQTPAAYDDADKILVLLSDGEFNTTYNIGDSPDAEYELVPDVYSADDDYSCDDDDDDDDDDDGKKKGKAKGKGKAFGKFKRCDDDGNVKSKEQLKLEILQTQNDNGVESNAYFQDACSLARDNGITIYAIALSLDAASEANLVACAGPEGRVFSADTASELSNAFKTIARQLSLRRLSS